MRWVVFFLCWWDLTISLWLMQNSKKNNNYESVTHILLMAQWWPGDVKCYRWMPCDCFEQSFCRAPASPSSFPPQTEGNSLVARFSTENKLHISLNELKSPLNSESRAFTSYTLWTQLYILTSHVCASWYTTQSKFKTHIYIYIFINKPTRQSQSLCCIIRHTVRRMYHVLGRCLSHGPSPAERHSMITFLSLMNGNNNNNKNQPLFCCRFSLHHKINLVSCRSHDQQTFIILR